MQRLCSTNAATAGTAPTWPCAYSQPKGASTTSGFIGFTSGEKLQQARRFENQAVQPAEPEDVGEPQHTVTREKKEGLGK